MYLSSYFLFYVLLEVYIKLIKTMNIWYKILQFFQDGRERSALILGFNQSSREAFISGVMPVMLEASVSRGEPMYRHQYSRWMRSGFRIKAFSGAQLTRQDIITLGKVILDDHILVRRLVVLGFDTLEVHCDVGQYGCKWQLKDFIALQ